MALNFLQMTWTSSSAINLFLFGLVLLSLSCNNVDCQEPGRGLADTDADLELGLEYLRKYQGLPASTSPSGVGSVISRSDVAASIVNMQRYMNVPLTGRIDSATKAKMQERRCGVPDPSGQDASGHALGGRLPRYAHTGGKWRKKKLTFRILNSPPELSIARTNNAIRRAFRLWEDVTPLEFRERNKGHADIYLSFGSFEHGDEYPFDGPGYTLAHAYPPQSGWGELDGDVHFDDSETFTVNTYSDINLFQVAAHEIGHSLGLAHSTFSQALMAPFYPGYIPDFRLPEDDRLGIQELYGSPTTRPDVNPTTKSPDTGGGGTPTTRAPDERCGRGYDAISLIRGELFAFQGAKYWRLRTPGQLISSEKGEKTSHFWQAFPNNIDAAYERYHDQKIFFFKGSEYFKYDGLSLVSGYPKPISSLDPNLPNNLDAVIGFNEYSKAYFIKGSNVWRYDEVQHRVDSGYPVHISQVFQGVGLPVSSAFLNRDGAGYFLKGSDYYRYNDTLKRVEDGFPRNFGVDFLGCSAQMVQAGGQVGGNNGTGTGGGGGNGGTGDAGHGPAVTVLALMFSAFLTLLLK